MKLKKILNMSGIPDDVKKELLEYQAENLKKIDKFEKDAAQALTEIAHLKSQIVEKDKFFSIVAHDLKGPLGSFLGLCECLMGEVGTMTINDLQEITSSMNTSANNLFKLLENLLDWSKARIGSTVPAIKWVDLHSVVDEAINLYRESAESKGIAIEKLTCMPSIQSDEQMLKTIVRNLIGNAVKYCSKGDSITVLTKQLSDNVEIQIIDTGIGMSPEILDGLFRLDLSVQRPGTNGELSTGLGLLLCKEFVELQGGKILAESKKGIGSTFSFTIPSKAFPK